MATTRTLTFDVTDNGSIQAVIGQAKRFQRRALKGIQASCSEVAFEYRDEVRRHAEGRPGPEKVSGAYWNSIEVVTVEGGFLRASFQTSVTSDHPAAARLELGYVGIDALGRHYNQPPFPHWGPAIDIVGPKWVKSFDTKVPEWWN